LTSDEKKRLLAQYRINQAYEALQEAELLFNNMMNPRSVINRLYYAMFYSVLALLVYEQYGSSKHKGVISYFNKRFIKEGIFPEKTAKVINKAFEMRIRGDYEEYSELTREEVQPFIEGAKDFVHTIEEHLKKFQLV